jgi:hypothetical protein
VPELLGNSIGKDIFMDLGSDDLNGPKTKGSFIKTQGIAVCDRGIAQTNKAIFCKMTHRQVGWRIVWDTKESGILWLNQTFPKRKIYEG